MHPDSLKVENFGSFEAGEYNFSSGLFLIEGVNEDKEGSSNGSGKSIFFTDALVWVLYENTCRGIKYDDVIRKGCQYTDVSVKLTHGDSVLTVRRRKDREKGSLLFLNDSRASQEDLERVLGLDYTTFTSSVIHAQLFRGFAERGETEQKEILTKLLGLEEWDEYKKRVNHEITLLNQSLISSDATKNAYEERVRKIEDDDEIKRQIEDFEENRSKKLESVTAEIAELQRAEDEFQKAIERHPLDPAQLDTLQDKKSVELAKLKDTQEQLNRAKQEHYKVQVDIAHLTKDIEKLAVDIFGLQKLKGNCPVCRQKINEKSKSACITEVETKLKQLDIERGIKNLEYANKSTNVYALTTKIAEVNKEIEKQDKCIDSVKAALAELDRYKMAQAAANVQKVAKFAVQIEIKLARNPYLEVQGINKTELAVLEREIAKLSETLIETQELKRYYEFWDEGFSNKGIKSYIFDAIIPEFTEKANHYIQLLTTTPIRIVFDTQREKKTGGLSEKFTIKLTDIAGERPYASWSGGEKKRISVAIDLALSNLVLLRSRVGWDFVIFDEVFDSLDEEGKEMMVYLLEDVMKERERVYVISHDSTMRGMIDNRILVTKKNGVSLIGST